MHEKNFSNFLSFLSFHFYILLSNSLSIFVLFSQTKTTTKLNKMKYFDRRWGWGIFFKVKKHHRMQSTYYRKLEWIGLWKVKNNKMPHLTSENVSLFIFPLFAHYLRLFIEWQLAAVKRVKQAFKWISNLLLVLLCVWHRSTTLFSFLK